MSIDRRIAEYRCQCSGLVAEVRQVGEVPVLWLSGGRARSAAAEAASLRQTAARHDAMGDLTDSDAAHVWAERYREQADEIEQSGKRPRYRRRMVDLAAKYPDVDGGELHCEKASCARCDRRYQVVVTIDGHDLRAHPL